MAMARAKQEAVPPSRLREMFGYDPETGHLTRLSDKHHGRWKAGRRVGQIATCGHRKVFVQGTYFYEHRVIYAIVTGEWPEGEIDHINGVRDDNRWENLRPATLRQNQQNLSVRRDSRSGVRGVMLCESGRWRARIKRDGRSIYLGRFDTMEEAAAAFAAAAKETFGDFGPRGTPIFGGKGKP